MMLGAAEMAELIHGGVSAEVGTAAASLQGCEEFERVLVERGVFELCFDLGGTVPTELDVRKADDCPDGASGARFALYQAKHAPDLAGHMSAPYDV